MAAGNDANLVSGRFPIVRPGKPYAAGDTAATPLQRRSSNMTTFRQDDSGEATPPAVPPALAAPHGAHRPGVALRTMLAACREMPAIPVVKQLRFLLRRVFRSVAGPYVDVQLWGLHLRLSPAGNVSEGGFLFMPHRWDRREREFLAGRLGPGAVFVDVGANAGGYLWWVQRQLGSDWRGVAVEPDPQLGARLEHNFAVNRMDHVRLFPYAVGPEPGEATLRIHPVNRGLNALVDEAEAGSLEMDTVRVRVVPLPELLKEAGLERVDALKIDVEGLEAAILEDFLDRAPPKLLPSLILMEMARESGRHDAVVRRLEGLGYEVVFRTIINVALARRG